MAEGGEKEKIKKACTCYSDLVNYITKSSSKVTARTRLREGGLTKVKKFKENET